MEFDKIFLTDSDIRILSKADLAAVVRLHSFDAEYLLSLGFIAPYALSERSDEYVITAEGSRYAEYYRQKQAINAKVEKRADKALTISEISLVVAVCSVLISLFTFLFR